jgi:hypothetical protein
MAVPAPQIDGFYLPKSLRCAQAPYSLGKNIADAGGLMLGKGITFLGGQTFS